MTLNGVIALILLYFTELDSFAAYYVMVVEDIPTLCLKKNIPDVFSYNSRKH